MSAQLGDGIQNQRKLTAVPTWQCFELHLDALRVPLSHRSFSHGSQLSRKLGRVRPRSIRYPAEQREGASGS